MAVCNDCIFGAPFGLGACEWQPGTADRIFADGFDGSRVNQQEMNMTLETVCPGARSLFGMSLTICLVLAANPALATGEPDSPTSTSAAACGDANGPICVGADPACQFTNLQDAIDAASDDDDERTTIRIAGNQDYDGQHLVISNRNITLQGGYTTCSAAIATGTTTLHGLDTHSVITIGADADHRSVTLSHLKIRDGGGNDSIGLHAFSVGGGLSIGGDVSVIIMESEIEHNTATLGGGIALGGNSFLWLTDSRISANSATNGVNGAAHLSGKGGGIYCLGSGSGGAVVFIQRSQILGNVAVADSNDTTAGGGVYLENCVFLGSAIEATLNMAAGDGGAGGGFYVGDAASVSGGMQINVNTGLFEGQSRINANIAGGDGGGIYSLRDVSLRGVAVENNIAGFSGAGNGGGIYMRGRYLTMDSLPWAGLSTLAGNSATGSGAAIFGLGNQEFLYVTIADTRIDGNGDAQSAAIIDLGNPGNSESDRHLELDMRNDLVVGNTAREALATVHRSQHTAGGISATSSTFADNTVDALFRRNDTGPGDLPYLYLSNSIVHEAIGLPVATTQGGVSVQCVIAHAGNGLPADSTVLTGDPRFVDADTGDYHLRSDSPAIDFCTSALEMPGKDLDGNRRGVDAPQAPPFLPGATLDLGAYEWVDPNDIIFVDGFEQATPHGASSPRQAEGKESKP